MQNNVVESCFQWQVEKDLLYKGLKMLAGVVESSQVLQILSNVHIKFVENNIVMTASDSEVEIVVKVKIKATSMNQPFAIAVSCRKLLDICRNLSSDVLLDFSYANSWLNITANGANFTLATLAADTFPIIAKSANCKTVSLESSQLKFLLQKTYFAMAQQDVRFFLNGLHVEVIDNKIIATATDAHRLARATIIGAVDVDDLNFILPRKAVLELMKLLVDSDAVVRIAVTEKNVCFYADDFDLTATLLEGNYPACDNLLNIPLEHSIAKINASELKQVLARATVLSHDKFKGAKLQFQANNLAVMANNAEQEKSQDNMSVDYSGENITLSFNANYLLDVLGVVTSSEVWFYLSSQQKSVLISYPDGLEDDNGSMFLIMPLAL